MKFSVAFVVLAGMTAIGAGSGGAQAPKTQWDGVYSDEQSKRGAVLYSRYCASCHGDALSGGGVESAPVLTGSKFTARWEDQTLGDLFERMVGSMPQDAPGSLARDQHVDILAFILARNGFPAGTADLSSKADALSTIRIVVRR